MENHICDLQFGPRKNIGRCRYDEKTHQIMIKVFPDGGYEYEVDLDRCKTAGAVLDWIHQVSVKTWGKDVLVDFIEILFDYISQDLWSWKN